MTRINSISNVLAMTAYQRRVLVIAALAFVAMC